MNIYDYIKKYGNYTFKEKTFCEIDNLVFSLLVYLDYTDLIEKNSTINSVGSKFLSKYTYKDMNSMTAYKDAYKCLKSIYNTNRYKDIVMYNYVYIGNELEQFSAVTFKISKRLIYIAFEGTDNLISGWREDFELAYKYPVNAQKHAIKYLRKRIHLFGPNAIVGGHSKGGNLALVSSMELRLYDKFKIINIYNNDGPGLKLKQFNSLKYKMIRKKHIHIIPYNSFFGILLRNDLYKCVDAHKIPIVSHAISSWKVNDDKLVIKNRDYNSLNLEKNVIKWLDNHDDEKRRKMIENVFKLFDECGIDNTNKFKNITNVINIIKNMKTIDKETKNLVIEFINNIFLK